MRRAPVIFYEKIMGLFEKNGNQKMRKMKKRKYDSGRMRFENVRFYGKKA